MKKKIYLGMSIIFTLLLFVGCDGLSSQKTTNNNTQGVSTWANSGGVGSAGGSGGNGLPVLFKVVNQSLAKMEKCSYSGKFCDKASIEPREAYAFGFFDDSTEDYLYFTVRSMANEMTYAVRTEEKISCKTTKVYTVTDGTIIRVEALNGKIKLLDLLDNYDPANSVIPDNPPPPPPTSNTFLTVKNQSSYTLSKIVFEGQECSKIEAGYTGKLGFDQGVQGYIYFNIGTQRYKTQDVITVEKDKDVIFTFTDNTLKVKIP